MNEPAPPINNTIVDAFSKLVTDKAGKVNVDIPSPIINNTVVDAFSKLVTDEAGKVNVDIPSPTDISGADLTPY